MRRALDRAPRPVGYLQLGMFSNSHAFESNTVEKLHKSLELQVFPHFQRKREAAQNSSKSFVD
jgi:hypothetical protein